MKYDLALAKQVQRDWSRRLGGIAEVVLAGGGVRDCYANETRQGRALVPRDWDVFLLMGGHVTSRDAGIMKQLYTATLDLKFVREWRSAYSTVLEQFECPLSGLPVQVMSSGCLAGDALVDNFDWRICRFLLADNYELLDGQLPQPGEELRLHKQTNAVANLRRGFRFAERYHMPLAPDTLFQLMVDGARQIRRQQGVFSQVSQVNAN